jgi:hypothetical protein
VLALPADRRSNLPILHFHTSRGQFTMPESGK